MTGAFGSVGPDGHARSGHQASCYPMGSSWSLAPPTAAPRPVRSGEWDVPFEDAPVGVSFAGATLTALADGRVLVAGPDASAMYDPDSGFPSVSGRSVTPREGQTATLLADGRVAHRRGHR